jgi:hypothetical protein
MIEHHSFCYSLEEHRLSGACRRHDQRALAKADRCDEIDYSTSDLRTRLRGTPGLQLELALGIRRGERCEFRTTHRGCRIVVVDLLYLDDYRPIAMITADCRFDLVAATQAERSHEMRRYVRVTGLGEVAELRPANEASVSLRIEPASELALRYDWCGWLVWAVLASRTAAAALMARVPSAPLSARIVITAVSSVSTTTTARALLILLAHGRLRCSSSCRTGPVIGTARSGALTVARALFCGGWRLRWNGGRWWWWRRRSYAVGVSIARWEFVLI